MTVVFAIRCADGLVLASDTQITQPDRGVSFPAAKLHPLGELAAWGGSGARAVLQDVEPVLSDAAEEILASNDPAREIRIRISPVFQHQYDQFIPQVPGEETPLSSTAPSVGGPYQIYRLRPDGSTLLSDDGIEEARGHVDRWTEMEKDVLDRLFEDG